MSDEIGPVSPQITYVGTTLRARTRQPTHQTCLPLNKCYTFWYIMIWSVVEYWHQKTLQALAVLLISQHQIRHIVGQIKELSAGCGALQPDIAI